MENTSVVEAMKAAGLYKEEGRVAKQTLKVIAAGGTREYELSDIDYLDLKTFADELDIALKLQNPYVQSLFARNALLLSYLIRSVNTESNSGFRGSDGAGRQLDAILLRCEQFQDPDEAVHPTYRQNWIRDITGPMAAGGATTFIESDETAGAELTMAADEGLAILGFADPIETPRVDAIQITKIAEINNIQNLDFRLANRDVGDAICELKQPLFLFPYETALINVKYFSMTDDELRPLGLWVKMSQDLRNLLRS